MGETDRLVIRNATLQDSAFLWQWRNDAATRRNSLNTSLVTWSQHEAWYSARLSDPDTAILVLADSHDGPQAQVRYHRRDTTSAEVHITVAPAARGNGFGTRILRDTAARALEMLSVSTIVAVVLQDNAASVRAFERAGYRRAGESQTGGRRYYSFEYSQLAGSQ